MIHKQYNEIMANSKKKFSNLYSAIDQGRSKILRTKWKPNVPGNKYYVSRNGRVYRNLENTLQAWFDGCLPTPNKIIYFNDVHHLHNQGLSNLEIANILPIHVSSVKRILNGKGLIKYKDKFKNYEQ
nr:MAG: zinc-binding loop region of homing endonuclease [Bacteriophage sp.]